MTEKRYLVKVENKDHYNRQIISYFGRDSIRLGSYGAGAVAYGVAHAVIDLDVILKGYKTIAAAKTCRVFKKSLYEVSIVEITLTDGVTSLIDTVCEKR